MLHQDQHRHQQAQAYLHEYFLFSQVHAQDYVLLVQLHRAVKYQYFYRYG